MNYNEDSLLDLAGIQHFFFCKRQWALIHIERQWEENQRTVEGKILHERVDDPYLTESRGEIIINRAVPLVSYTLGLKGVADLIEFRKSRSGIKIFEHDGRYLLKPVEYKRGKPKIDKRDEVQLCAQVMCLEEMYSINISSADLYYYEIRRRITCKITEDLKNLVIKLSKEMHEVFVTGITPTADGLQNCKNCSLVEICIPKLTLKKTNVMDYITKHVKKAGNLNHEVMDCVNS